MQFAEFLFYSIKMLADIRGIHIVCKCREKGMNIIA